MTQASVEETPKPKVHICEYGIATLEVPLEWGERVSFCAEKIPDEQRDHLGKVIQHQVNEIIMRQRHDAVEQFKKQYNQLMSPQTLRGYEDQHRK